MLCYTCYMYILKYSICIIDVCILYCIVVGQCLVFYTIMNKYVDIGLQQNERNDHKFFKNQNHQH